MQQHRLPKRAVMLGVLLMLTAAAATAANAPEPMTLMEQSPRAKQVMSGSGIAFSLTFDRPVDHHQSRLVVVDPGGNERVLEPRLVAQPNTLYASVGRLAPGDYELRWDARAMSGFMLNGIISFSVKP